MKNGRLIKRNGVKITKTTSSNSLNNITRLIRNTYNITRNNIEKNEVNKSMKEPPNWLRVISVASMSAIAT